MIIPRGLAIDKFVRINDSEHGTIDIHPIFAIPANDNNLRRRVTDVGSKDDFYQLISMGDEEEGHNEE